MTMIAIDKNKCLGCCGCIDLCRAAAILLVEDKAHPDEERCVQCETCIQVCPMKAIVEESADAVR
jgi:ferredoxin